MHCATHLPPRFLRSSLGGLLGRLEFRHHVSEIVERRDATSERRVVLTRTLAKLAEERGKLLQAFYANAISLELLKAEQDRRRRAGLQERARGCGGPTWTARRTSFVQRSGSPVTATPPT